MNSVIFLGPYGSTFSHDAYNCFSDLYPIPHADERNYYPANSNEVILDLIRMHGGYGTIAMDTLTEGRYSETLNSFIGLLKVFPKQSDCTLNVIGAIKMRINFCLMARKGIREQDIQKVVAHPKALGACRKKINNSIIFTEVASSNGEAARLVAENDAYKNAAALGPKSASIKYGLNILSEAFEDGIAATTFFLITPASCRCVIGKNNRVLIVFRLPHTPGSLVESLLPFKNTGLNLIQIHSVHSGNHTYDFAIEIEVEVNKLPELEKALSEFKKHVSQCLEFGPFEVLSV